MPEIALRPITPGDEELLYRVYASTRAEELAQVDWGDDEKSAFLRQQFLAQHRYYQEHYAGSRFDLILAAGEPIGRLYVARWPREIRLVEIALLPEHRGQGIGERLLRDLLEEGAVTGRPVTIHVEVYNPARRLYERLGFRSIADRGVYQLMEWRPEGLDAAAPG